MASLENRDWQLHEYTIACTISVPGVKDYILNDIQIEGMYIEKDYDNDHFPIMLLDLSISKKMEYEIIEHKSDVTFNITIEMYVKEPENPDYKTDRRQALAGVFTPIIPEATPETDTSRELRRLIRDNDQISQDDDFIAEDSLNKVTYILIKKDMTKIAKTVVNGVLVNVDLTTAISYLLTKSGAKNVLLSNFDNTDIIPELLLLPIPMLDEMRYLSNYYGFHKEGTQIFFDFDTIYINRMDGKSSAWKRNEPKNITIFIGRYLDRRNIVSGSFEDGDTVFINVDKDGYQIKDNSSASDQIMAQNITLINESSASVKMIDTGGEFTTIRSTQGHNKYLETEIACRKKEMACILYCMFTYADITSLTPNKQYRVITDDTSIVDKVQGTYRIAMQSTTFIREGNHFITNTLASLRRVSTS